MGNFIVQSSPMDAAMFKGHTNIMNMILEHFVHQMMLSDNMDGVNAEFGYHQ